MNLSREAPSRAAMAPRRTAVIVPLLVALAVLPLAEPASASHYNLDRVDLVTAAERRALSRAGVLDTKVLLAWTAKLSRRQWLADETGMSWERLSELAALCDLLRVEGVGPSIAEVLVKSGAPHASALAGADPQALLDRMRVATRGTSMRLRLPDPDTIRSWIRIARGLRPVLEDGAHRQEP